MSEEIEVKQNYGAMYVNGKYVEVKIKVVEVGKVG